MIDITEQTKIYDTIYREVENYNFRDPKKDNYIDKFAELIGKDKSFVDLGCGEGANVKRLIKFGYNIEGVEISQVCCESFLRDVPHYNLDIQSFAKLGKKYDAAICMDVLEHLPSSEIDDVIKSIAGISSNAFLGIANHSDILNGVELHLIQKDMLWWRELLSKYFKQVVLINEMQYGTGQNIFFIFLCSNINLDITNYNYHFYNEILESLRSDIELVNKININLQHEVSRVNEVFNTETARMNKAYSSQTEELQHVKQININLQHEVSRVNEIFNAETARMNKAYSSQTEELQYVKQELFLLQNTKLSVFLRKVREFFK